MLSTFLKLIPSPFRRTYPAIRQVNTPAVMFGAAQQYRVSATEVYNSGRDMDVVK